jgi:hypothetical protein
VSQNESEQVMPDGRLSVLCRSLLFYKHVKEDVYGFGVEDVEITEVAGKAGITKVAEMAEIAKRVQGIQMTARHVIQPVTEKAKVFIKTTRHVM